MTKTDLKKKMQEFIALQDNNDEDEWYASQQHFAKTILSEFAKYLNIDLTVQSIQIEKE